MHPELDWVLLTDEGKKADAARMEVDRNSADNDNHYHWLGYDDWQVFFHRFRRFSVKKVAWCVFKAA
ncbi:MAG: hypothetical protein V2I33_26410 [Kangiellaceae bacterium]|nr:hypothetical protein [Kangiellaceae bacterium]